MDIIDILKNLFNLTENIYGSVGYTILENPKHKVIIFADMHDTLKACPDYIHMSDWLKNNSSKYIVLLEEVDRNQVKLKELWTEAVHTQKLKNLYLDNKEIIVPVDIRPQLIPFSWETLMMFTSTDKSSGEMLLKEWLKDLIEFHNGTNKYINDKIGNINNEYVKKHFNAIKKLFDNFIKVNIKLMDKKVSFIALSKPNFTEIVNNILDNAMEWYCCALISKYIDKDCIIHAGLAHTTKINKILTELYDYKLIKSQGLVDLSESENVQITGCVKL